MNRKKWYFPILTISSSFTNLLRRGRSRRRKKNPYSQQQCLFVLQLFFHVNILNFCNQKTESKNIGGLKVHPTWFGKILNC